MEKEHELAGNASAPSGIGSRYFDLKKSFNTVLRPLLTGACSDEEFLKAFPRFTFAEKDFVHKVYLQVIASLQKNLEAEFESICLEGQVGTTLDAVEKIVEEQELDLLFSKKSNAMDVAKNLSAVKKEEMQQLKRIIEQVEKRNQVIRTKLQVLKEGRQV